jgi:hypothetical protein
MRTFKLAAIAALALAVSAAFSQTTVAPKATGGKTTVTAPSKGTPAQVAPKDTGGAAKTVAPAPQNPANSLLTPQSSAKSADSGSAPSAAITSSDTGASTNDTGDTSPPAKINWSYVGFGGLAVLVLLYILYSIRKSNRQATSTSNGQSGLQVNYGRDPAPSAASSQAAGTTGRSMAGSQQSTPPSSAPSNTPPTPPAASSSDPTQLNMGGSDQSSK